MAVKLNYAKRNRQLARLARNKKKLSSYNYQLLYGWIINWEFMGETGDKNLSLNLKDRLKR